MSARRNCCAKLPAKFERKFARKIAKGISMRFFLKYNYIQVDNTCYKDLQTLASGYKVEYVLYIFISPAIFFYLFYLFLFFCSVLMH